MASNSKKKAQVDTIKEIVAERETDSIGREPVRIMLVGSNPGIRCVVKDLYRLGFAEVDDWSKAQPYPNSGQSMSVLTKWRSE